MGMTRALWSEPCSLAETMKDLHEVPLLQGSVLGISKQEIFSAHHWALAEVVLDALAVVGDKKRTRSFRPLPLRTNRPRSCGFQSSTSRCRTSLALSPLSASTRISARLRLPIKVSEHR